MNIGDVRTPGDLAVLLIELLDRADGELAAGGQWGRAMAMHREFFEDGFTRFTIAVQGASFDNDLKPLPDGPKLRSFKIEVRPL